MRSHLVKVAHAHLAAERPGRGAAGMLIAGTLSLVMWAAIVGVAQVVF